MGSSKAGSFVGGGLKHIGGKLQGMKLGGGRAGRIVSSIGGKIGGAASSVGGAMETGGLAGGAMAGAAEAVGAIASSAGPALAIAGAYKAAFDATSKWTTEALKSAEALKSVSGSMSAVFAEKEQRDMLRNQMEGELTAGSTQSLMKSEASRKDAALGINTDLTNASNNIMAGMNDVFAPFMNGLSVISDGIKENTGFVGRIWKELTSGASVGVSGMVAESERLKASTEHYDKKGKEMMEAAKRGSEMINRK